MTVHARRLLGFAVAAIWVMLTGWILLFGSALVGVAIDVDATPVMSWLVLSASASVICLLAFWWWPTMVLSAIAAVGLTEQVAGSMAGSSPGVVSALLTTAGISVAIGASSALGALTGLVATLDRGALPRV